jgi:protease IV
MFIFKPKLKDMNFVRNFFACLLALVVFSAMSLVLFIVFLGSITAEKQVVVKDNSVLHLKLDGPITELQVDNPLSELPVFSGEGENVGLLQLKQAIAHAKNDNKIKGIYLECSYPQTGFATLEEIRQSLLDFRESGKWVVAYNTVMSEGAFYLATAADKIYMNPEGDVEFNGLALQVSFFKRLFDKLEIKPQVFRVGEFKSAVEPFLLEQMSKENELQLTELINAINDHMVQRISEARNVSVQKLREISDNMMVRNARLAKEFGLVDDLFFEDEFQDNIRERLGVAKDDDVNYIRYGRYRKTVSSFGKSKNEIAVIVAEGTIMPGENKNENVGIAGETFVKEIRKARNNDKIKAIVLRINSPGGEFRASDMIWREIQLAKQQKPVIASMSDYAASGGYYLAMGCDTIVAQPNTITGSIGIFGMMFDMSSFLGNKIGITFDEVKTGKYGNMYTVARPLTEGEKQYWQKNLEEHYDTFTAKAAEGRGLKQDDILQVASGRVWTGSQAQERKLVDIEGGFDDAVTIAAAKAALGDDYRLKYYPKRRSFIDAWLSQAEGESAENKMKNELGEFYIYYEQIQRLKTWQGAQARMPFEFKLH